MAVVSPTLKLAVIAVLAVLLVMQYRRRRQQQQLCPKQCQIAGLFIYPVKGLQGYAVDSVRCLERGMEHDRRFMIVDSNRANSFCTQREFAQMARIQCRVVFTPAAGKWVLELIDANPSGEVKDTIQIADWDSSSKTRMTVRVWSAHCDLAVDQGQAVADWLDRVLAAGAEHAFRLVFMGDDCVRVIDATTPTPNDAEQQQDVDEDTTSEVSFADGFPYLVASTSSLDELNARLVARGQAAVPMTRFRPNIVLAGLPAWAEDRVGTKLSFANGMTLRVVKPCDRCKVTTIDQQTGEICQQGEPIATLQTFRRLTADMRVFFASNAVLYVPAREPLTLSRSSKNSNVVEIEWGGA